MKRTKRPPTFVSAGMVTINVSKMTFNLLALLMSLKILTILNALMRVVIAPIVKGVTAVTIIEIKVITTTAKSN